jgi:hypothetical protein
MIMGLFTTSLSEKYDQLTASFSAERDEKKLYDSASRALLQTGEIKELALYFLDRSGKKYERVWIQSKSLQFAQITELEETAVFSDYLRHQRVSVLKLEPPYFSEKEEKAQQAMASLGADICIPLLVAGRVMGFFLLTVKGIWDMDRTRHLERGLTSFGLCAARLYYRKCMKENETLFHERAILENVLQQAIQMNHQINDPMGIIVMKTEHFLRRLHREWFQDNSSMQKSLQQLIRSHIMHCHRVQQAALRFREDMSEARRKLEEIK